MRKLIAKSLLALSLLTSVPANAGGVPVIDTSSIAQAIATLQQLQKTYGVESKQLSTGLKQLDEAITAANRLQTQIDQLERQFESLTGNRDMGALLNGSASRDARRIASKIGDIHATLQGEEGALAPDHPLAGRLTQMRTRFAIPDAATVFDEARVPEKVAAHDFASETTATAIVLSEDSFDRANVSINRVETLLGAIDTDTPDLKASVDLNTRMLGELAFMLADAQRVDAAVGQMVGALANESLRDRETGKRRLSFAD